MSASVPEHLKRSLHPSYPSGIPAFSKKNQKTNVPGNLKDRLKYTRFIFFFKKGIQTTDPLNFTVSSIKDGDTQLKGGSHHRTSLTCICVERQMKFIICGQASG